MTLKTVLIALVATIALAGCQAKQKQATTGQGTGGAGGQQAVRTTSDRVFFNFDSSELRPDARATIEQWAAMLKDSSDTLTIEGHADERGTREYNLALGARRANSVKNYLVALGIPNSRVRTISYGKERPANGGHNEQAWAENRRGVLIR